MGKAEDYIIELVQINVKNLLAEANEDDSAVVNDFIMFLKSYMLKHRKSINFSKLATFDKIKVSMCFNCNIYFSIRNIGSTEISKQV